MITSEETGEGEQAYTAAKEGKKANEVD